MKTQVSNRRLPGNPLLRRLYPKVREDIRYLFWFLKLTYQTAPNVTELYMFVAVMSGLAVPVELLATERLVDALAIKIAGLGGNDGVHVTNAPNLLSPWLWLALVLTALILRQTLRSVERMQHVRFTEFARPELRRRAMEKASRLPLIYFENQAHYDKLYRILSAAHTSGTDLVVTLVDMLRALPAVVAYAAVLAIYAPPLLIIAIISMIPVAVEFFMAGKVNWNILNEQTRERRLADYYARTLVNRENAKEMRLYGLARHLLDRWSQLYWETRNEQRRAAFRLGLRQRGMVLAARAVGMFGLFWVVSAGMISATPGQYAIIFLALENIWGLFDVLSGLVVAGKAAGYAAELHLFMTLPEEPRYQQTAEWPTTGPEPLYAFPTPMLHGIRFEDVWFTYPDSDVPSLAGVTFEIRAGETVALVGENGAGKSTLVKLLLGLYQPDRGRITVDGIDIRQIHLDSLRKAASAIFQHFVQYRLTLGENIYVSQTELAADGARMQASAMRAGVHDFVQRMEDGYNTVLGPDVGGTELSGGQWQRVALARAFFREAQVLILDEPTAALDPMSEVAIFERFAELSEGRATLLISHRLGMARLADRIVVLKGGQVVEEGSHNMLIQAGGEYAALFQAQARWYA